MKVFVFALFFVLCFAVINCSLKSTEKMEQLINRVPGIQNFVNRVKESNPTIPIDEIFDRTSEPLEPRSIPTMNTMNTVTNPKVNIVKSKVEENHHYMMIYDITTLSGRYPSMKKPKRK